MKQISVVAAVIHNAENHILATQRGYGDWEGWWEFPGGKIEADEVPESALRREISEELSANIRVEKFICTVEYDYPTFHLSMRCYLCALQSEIFHLNEHTDARWVTLSEIDCVKWLPADIEVVNELKRILL